MFCMSTINIMVQGLRVGDKKRNKDRERGREREMLDAPIRVSISVVVTEEVVLSCCLVAGYLQRLVNRWEQVFTQTRDLQSKNTLPTSIIPHKTSVNKITLYATIASSHSRTKSIRSERFFSMSCGGRRLIRSRAQSSCWSWLACNSVSRCTSLLNYNSTPANHMKIRQWWSR